MCEFCPTSGPCGVCGRGEEHGHESDAGRGYWKLVEGVRRWFWDARTPAEPRTLAPSAN